MADASKKFDKLISDRVKKKEFIKNPSGSLSTERTITVSVDDGYINIPTIVKGKQLSPKQAVSEAMQNKVKYKVHKSIDAAETAAKDRSEKLGLELKKLGY
jgi:hypothetical protein|tara:strand:+ start:35 stop:337 length:303 start_codon:yes stop_codon:yes gene_type:complete